MSKAARFLLSLSTIAASLALLSTLAAKLNLTGLPLCDSDEASVSPDEPADACRLGACLDKVSYVCSAFSIAAGIAGILCFIRGRKSGC